MNSIVHIFLQLDIADVFYLGSTMDVDIIIVLNSKEVDLCLSILIFITPYTIKYQVSYTPLIRLRKGSVDSSC